MTETIATRRREDGAWLVIIARPGSPAMEFVCESEEQAVTFATSLQSPRKALRDRVEHKNRVTPAPSRTSGFWQRLIRST